MWVKESDWSNETYLFEYRNNGTSEIMLLKTNSSGQLEWKITAGTTSTTANAHSLTNNNWHHLVMTRDESGNPGGCLLYTSDAADE